MEADKATETIRVSKEVKSRLDRLKVHEREPYNDVIERALKALEEEL